MPLYDFFCPACTTAFEELADPGKLPPCPQCGNTQTERRMSAPSPLKTNPFPYKVGPVHPIANKMASGGSTGGCGGSGGFS